MSPPSEDFGRMMPSVSVPPPGPRSQELATRLREVESRNVTFLGDRFPVFWSEAKGANVRDVDGNVFLDLTAAFGVSMAGHGHPVIARRIQAQAELLLHGMGDVHPTEVRVRLLERLSSLAPWEGAKSVLASSGSEGVEIALKAGLLASGRPGIVAFQGGYHGLTLGSLSTTHRSDFRDPFTSRLFPAVSFAPFPGAGSRGNLEDSLGALEDLLSRGPSGPVGTVIVEPIQGRAGVVIPPSGFLSGVVERARAVGAVVVFDEVFTGMGRTGRNFAFEHEGAIPDLLVIGKALGGGMPLSACLGRPEVMAAWPESHGEAIHTSTFLGHPLSCAAALGFLDVLEEEGLADACGRKGEMALDILMSGLAGIPQVREVRGRGLAIGIEFWEPGSGEPAAGMGASVAEFALRAGLLVLPAGPSGEVVELAPPATITDAQMREGLHRLVKAIEAVV